MNLLGNRAGVLPVAYHRPAIDFVGQRKAKRACSSLESRDGGAHAAKKARLWLRLVVVGFSAVLLVRLLAPQIDAALTEHWTLYRCVGVFNQLTGPAYNPACDLQSCFQIVRT